MHCLHVVIILFSQVYISLYFLPVQICNFPLSLFYKSPFLSSLLHNKLLYYQVYYTILLIAFEPFLFLSAFSVFLNDYFFRWLACKSLLSRFSVIINQIMQSYKSFFCIQLFLMFFRIDVFQHPGLSGSESRLWVHGLEMAQRQCVYFLTLKKKTNLKISS